MIAARLGVSRLQLRLQPLRMLVLLAQMPPFGLVRATSAKGQLRLRVPRAGAYTWQNLLQQKGLPVHTRPLHLFPYLRVLRGPRSRASGGMQLNGQQVLVRLQDLHLLRLPLIVKVSSGRTLMRAMTPRMTSNRFSQSSATLWVRCRRATGCGGSVTATTRIPGFRQSWQARGRAKRSLSYGFDRTSPSHRLWSCWDPCECPPSRPWRRFLFERTTGLSWTQH